jgi:hypothetical protein
MTNVSNIKVFTDFSTTLYFITDAPWYVPNDVIKRDLQVASVRQELRTFSVIYHARLEGHPIDLATSLLQQPPHNHRLKRYFPADLVTRFYLVLSEPPSDHNQSTVIVPDYEICHWIFPLHANVCDCQTRLLNVFGQIDMYWVIK